MPIAAFVVGAVGVVEAAAVPIAAVEAAALHEVVAPIPSSLLRCNSFH